MHMHTHEHISYVCVDGRIILKRILNRLGVSELESSVSGHGPVVDSYEHGNESSGSIKGG